MRIFKAIFTAGILSLCAVGAVLADGTPPFETCVVNHDKFSEHSKGPIDVSYNGRTIQVCCKSCVRKFNKDPEKFLKAWDEALAKSGKPAQAAK